MLQNTLKKQNRIQNKNTKKKPKNQKQRGCDSTPDSNRHLQWRNCWLLEYFTLGVSILSGALQTRVARSFASCKFAMKMRNQSPLLHRHQLVSPALFLISLTSLILFPLILSTLDLTTWKQKKEKKNTCTDGVRSVHLCVAFKSNEWSNH